MRTLYHLWLSPPSRVARLVLAEKNLDFDMVVEKTWTRRDAFLEMNPAGEVPVLVEENLNLCGSLVIAEYLEEREPRPILIGASAKQKAETRRLVDWFTHKFQTEVTKNLLDEKIMKRFLGQGEPRSSAIRAGHHNLKTHLHYIGFLAQRRRWLAGTEFSLADITAAAQLSCLDYLGDVPWGDFPDAKEWYAKVKSRPSFRPILGDHIPGLPPPKHYADLDF